MSDPAGAKPQSARNARATRDHHTEIQTTRDAKQDVHPPAGASSRSPINTEDPSDVCLSLRSRVSASTHGQASEFVMQTHKDNRLLAVPSWLIDIGSLLAPAA